MRIPMSEVQGLSGAAFGKPPFSKEVLRCPKFGW